MTPAWQSRRARFNHDWLKNGYLPALSAWLQILDGKVQDPELERTFLSARLPQWLTGSQEVLELLTTFEAEMSPRRLLDVPPLSNMSANDRQWLAPVLHASWLRRWDVAGLLARAEQARTEVDAAYAAVSECVASARGAAEAQKCRAMFLDLRTACRNLATAIEAFPSRVRP